MIKNTIMMVLIFIIIVITLIDRNIHIDRIMLVVFFMWVVMMIILTFKPKMFRRYVNMRERHRKINREELGIK